MTELNPGIRRTVVLLNANGHITCDSGDGETHDHTCDRPGPYVVVMSTPDRLTAEARAITALLGRHGIQLVPVGNDGVYIQASYDPALGDKPGAAVIDISGIHDRMLP